MRPMPAPAAALHPPPPGGSLSGRALALLLGIVLLGFAVRAYQLAGQSYRWDEGWSIGLASLPVEEILRITALDVHPPLYYLLLKVWLRLGPHEGWVRFLSLLSGLPAVPLAFLVGRRAFGTRGGMAASLYVSLAPILVYYSQTARMYALSASALLLAAYGMLRALEGRRWGWFTFVCGGLLALYTFYYTAFALAGLCLYALLRWRQAGKPLAFSVCALVLGYSPWALYAAPALLQRISRRAEGGASLAGTLALVRDGLNALIFAPQPAWLAMGIVLALVLAAVLARGERRPLLLPALAVLATLLGVALGSRAHMFAPRYTIGASPFLGLLIGAGMAALWARSRWLLLPGLAALSLITLPGSAGFVYAKTSEVLEPFDPAADHAFIHDRAASYDVVVFNVLSLAGTYQRYRSPEDPSWSYGLRWDPVVEPLEVAKDRIRRLATRHGRLWFVLYQGGYGPNEPLKSWLDHTFFPAGGQWQGSTLYSLYVVPPPSAWVRRDVDQDLGELHLRWAEYTRDARQGGTVGVKLRWQAPGKPRRDWKVFVHGYDATGRLVTQHDSFPVNDLRPPTTWAVAEQVLDLHGLALPPSFRGRLTLAVGLYDPTTGERARTEGGMDMVILGSVQVR